MFRKETAKHKMNKGRAWLKWSIS